MNTYLAYFVVFLLGATPFFEVVAVIPIGIAAGLQAFPVALAAFAGNIATILLLIALTDQTKRWLERRKEKKGKNNSEKKQQRAAFVWKKYGLPGLSLVAPFITGSHLGAVLAMSFGGTKKQITFWMVISIVIWTIIMGVASYYGIDYFFDRTNSDGFLTNLLD
ncbi:small multi-drug export protein [Oceanobacillus kapialis]|uniref:Small multi-drug export protein n=1 Tax=Oceanobacillus kapialis TaxID=481353 RepID=A0ABW5Q328_9BACI